MRARYSEYFLNHVLLLQDELATYYVQDRFSVDNDFLGVELKTFFDHREAVEWLKDCVSYDNGGIRNLRYFLDESAPHSYELCRWDDYQVMDQAAWVIMDYDYPVVISPIFESPELESEIFDVICDIQNSELLPIQNGKEPGEIFQFCHVGEYAYDENIALNILKLLPNTANNIWNIGVDAVNVVLHDAQYISQKGGREYLKARLNTELNWSKEAAEALSNLVKDGPREVMDFLTDPDMDAVKDFFKSVLYAKNWENALAIGLAIGLTKKIHPGAGGGAKTTGTRSGAGGPGKVTKSNKKAVKSKPAPQQKPKPTLKQKPDAGPKTKPKRDLKKEYAEIMDADDTKSIKKNLTKKGVKFSKKEKDNLKEILNDPDFQEMAPGADFKKAKQRIDKMSDELSPEEIQEIKKYMFDNKEWSGYDPNNATAWKNLQKGKITEVEETLLKHERVELLFRRKLKDCGIELDYTDAHFEAENLYNFAKVAEKTPDFPFKSP